MKGIVSYCLPDLSVLNEDSQDYYLGWVELSPSNPSVSSSMNYVAKAFKFQRESDLGNLPYSSKYNTYSGGGYVCPMVSFIHDEIQSHLSELNQLVWIDRNTRVVTLQFTLYNPNNNLFMNNHIMFEILPTGNVLKSYRFEPIKLQSYTDSSSVMATSLFEFAFNIAFLICVLLILADQMKKIYKVRSNLKSYFSSFWNWTDLALVGFSFASLAMYLYRFYASFAIFDRIKASKSDFTVTVNLEYNVFFYFNNILVIIVTTQIFIKIFELLQ